MTTNIWQGSVLSEWVDYNGHMNDAEYARVFSLALDAFMIEIGINEDFRTKAQYTIYTLETHLLYKKEAHENDAITVQISILDRDSKRMHLLFTMKNSADDVVAASEQMVMGMDQSAGRPAPFPDVISTNIDKLPAVARENWPQEAARTIGIRRK